MPSEPARDLVLPAGTILLHIGPPKTGTSTLQGAFHAARDAVLAQGVRYAGRARHSGSAVLAVTGRPSFQRDSGSPPIGEWRALLREIRSAREPRVVLSSEFFADAEPDAIRRIVDDLGRGRVHVVVTLRPLARLLASQWQQYTQSFMRVPYGEWLDAMLNGPPGTLTPTFWRRHRHDALVDRWATEVGAANVTVVVIDERDHDHILRVFERLTGLRAGTLVADEDLMNRSMTLPEIEAVRAFNIAFREAGLGNALFHRVMHFGVAPFMKTRRPPADEPRIETPQWALDRSAEIAREMVDRIGARGVRVVGDLAALTVVPRSPLGDAATEQAVCIPPAIAASVTMGVVVVAGHARGRGIDEGRVVPAPAAADAATDLGRLALDRVAGVLVLRVVTAGLRLLRRAIGYVRPQAPVVAPRPATPEAAALHAVVAETFRAADLDPRLRKRLIGQAPGGGAIPTVDCIPPSIAAELAIHALVATGLAHQAGTATDGVPRLRRARSRWAEPPEVAVVPTPRLARIVLRRLAGRVVGRARRRR